MQKRQERAFHQQSIDAWFSSSPLDYGARIGPANGIVPRNGQKVRSDDHGKASADSNRQGARHRPGERIPGVGGGRRIVTGARLRPSKRVKRVKFAAFVASNTPRRRSGTSAPKEEDAMNSRRLYGTIALALACGIGTGAAQVGQIQLDAKQKAAIVSAVRDVRNAPPGHRRPLTNEVRKPLLCQDSYGQSVKPGSSLTLMRPPFGGVSDERFA